MQHLEAILQQQPYLLGDRPCLADFGFFGSMFWHFSADPTSNRIMQEQAPGVNEWVARLWNAKHNKVSHSKKSHSKMSDQPFEADFQKVLTLWRPLLNDVLDAYLPYLHLNALAYSEGKRRFDFRVQDTWYKGVHVSPYRVWCREKLQEHFQQLSGAEQATLKQVLGPEFDSLLIEHQRASNWDPENIAPLCKPGKIPLYDRLTSRFTGTNHIRTRRAWDK